MSTSSQNPKRGEIWDIDLNPTKAMVTNFFRISLPFESFHIQRVPYSDEKFATLRKQHNKDASFFRHGECISPRKGAGLEIGEELNPPDKIPKRLSEVSGLGANFSVGSLSWLMVGLARVSIVDALYHHC
jgi:hypothetical protein